MKVMEKFIVDRFEGEYAVLERESGGMQDILKATLGNVKEGDVLILENGKYRFDREETLKRKAMIKEKMRKLFEKE